MNSMVMQADIISNWEDRHESLFGVELVKLNHRLIDSGLFSREALGKVIERCPAEHLGLRAMGTEIDDPKRMEGELGNASGMEAIEAIEKGRMWMNIRRVMDWAPEYRTLLDEVFGEFEARMPGFKTFKRNLGVLISSPNANVFYHADIQGQSLWQIEGIKSVYHLSALGSLHHAARASRRSCCARPTRTCPTRTGSTTMRRMST